MTSKFTLWGRATDLPCGSEKVQATAMLLSRAQGREEREERALLTQPGLRGLRGREVRQRVKRCGGLAWRLHWCTPRHLQNFSTKRFGGSLEPGHHLPEQDRRNMLLGEAHWEYWVTFWMNICKSSVTPNELTPKRLKLMLTLPRWNKHAPRQSTAIIIKR